MSCPGCGHGGPREAIAANLWRCQAQVDRRVRKTVGDINFRPGATKTVRVTCGVEYQEGTPDASTPQCRCGLFAIGICGVCGDPVCGNHSNLQGHTLSCTATWHLRRADELRRQAERNEFGKHGRVPSDAEAAIKHVGVKDPSRWVVDFISEMRSKGNPGAVELGVYYGRGLLMTEPTWRTIVDGWVYSETERIDRVGRNPFRNLDDPTLYSVVTVEGALVEAWRDAYPYKEKGADPNRLQLITNVNYWKNKKPFLGELPKPSQYPNDVVTGLSRRHQQHLSAQLRRA